MNRNIDSYMQDMVPKIICSRCRQPLWFTWTQQSIRCQYCDCVNMVITKTKILSSADSDTKGFQIGDICGRLRTSTIQGTARVSSERLPSRSSTVHPWKRAVLCGVSYRKKGKLRLRGTVNDVILMQDLLVNNYSFPRENIRVLTEEEKTPSLTPTRKNIIESLRWLVEGNQAGDSLLFYFSGHGFRQKEFNGEEHDGYDETLCPLDFMMEGMISDDEINSIIVRPLNKDVTLHAIIDACYSGTIMDLAYAFDYFGKKWIDNCPASQTQKGTSGGLAISLTACKDDEVAADTSAFSNRMNGAMTYTFVQTVKNNPEISYGRLLDLMCKHIQEVNQKQSLRARIRRMFLHEKKFELPQLSSSQKFDACSKKFTL